MMTPIYNNKFSYPKLIQETQDNGIRHYVTPSNNRVPQVTTIISEVKDMSAIYDWRKRIGDDKADEITKLQSDIGTHMHDNIEKWLKNEGEVTGNNLMRTQGKILQHKIIDTYLKPNLSEWWGAEEHMHYENLYAGTSDLIGIYKGEPQIIDFKNQRKPKKLEYIDGYRLQLAAYALAHNHNYGTDIKQGVILMASREKEHFGKLQEFIINLDLFERSCYEWTEALETYYSRRPS